jgi:hypothetical protein
MTAGSSTFRRFHRRWLSWSLVLVGLVGTAGRSPGRDSAPTDRLVLSGAAGVTRVAQLTGADSPNRTDRFGVVGTDLGSMFEADGKVWFAFGDTFSQREPGFTGGGGGEWRSKALAYTGDIDPTDDLLQPLRVGSLQRQLVHR